MNYPINKTEEKISSPYRDYHEFTYSINDNPMGKSWEYWTTRWWRWILSIPKAVNPGYDETGHKLEIELIGQSVLFLPGTFGGFAERYYSVQSRPMLLPIINFITSFSEEPEIKTEKGLLEHAKKDIDDIVNTFAVVDGVEVPVRNFRVQSSVIDLKPVVDNVFGIKTGPTRAAHDGYWLFLRPLSEGKHEIRVFGSCSSGKTKVGVVLHIITK